MKITPKQRLAQRLRSIAEEYKGDPERAHDAADGALLTYINSPEVTEAYDAIEKWYA